MAYRSDQHTTKDPTELALLVSAFLAAFVYTLYQEDASHAKGVE